MSTRSLTTVFSRGEPLTTIYRQSDGYPEGLGHDLYNFLKGRVIGNGIRMDSDMPLFSNGASDMGAQLMTYLKGSCDSVGGVYAHSTLEMGGEGEVEASINACKDCFAEYAYNIHCNESGEIEVAVIYAYRGEIFRGSPDEMAQRWNFDPDKTLYARHMANLCDISAGNWLAKNISFRVLEKVVDAYLENPGGLSFPDFLKTPENPSKGILKALDYAAGKKDFYASKGRDVSFKDVARAIENYRDFVDPGKVSLGDWLRANASLDPENMGNLKNDRPKSPKA